MGLSGGRRDGERAERLFITLLRPGALHGCDEVTADDLSAAAQLASTRGLFPLVDRRIREDLAPLATGPAGGGYEQAVRRLRLRHISHALRHERAEMEVLALLEAAAVPSVVLKGSALSRELHGDPHCRTCADIDLLVRPGDVAAADAVLREAGFRRDDDQSLSFWMRRLHHALYQHPDQRVPVEMHWNFSIPGFFNLDPAEIWDGVLLDGLRGHLEPSLALLLLLLHHHLHGCADLRTLVDLVWAFDRHREVLASGRLIGRLEATGLCVVAGIARLQVETLWGPQRWHPGRRGAHHAIRARLLARIAGLSFGPVRPPRASDRFRHALIHRLALDSPRRMLGSITKTLLPSAADMRALTGGDQSALSGYVRYFRWRFAGPAAGSDAKGGARR
jgi:hypothetical protein